MKQKKMLRKVEGGREEIEKGTEEEQITMKQKEGEEWKLHDP